MGGRGKEGERMSAGGKRMTQWRRAQPAVSAWTELGVCAVLIKW